MRRLARWVQLALVVLVPLMSAGPVLAVDYPPANRNFFEGYFTGINAGSGEALFDLPAFTTVTNGSEFIAAVNVYLNSTGPRANEEIGGAAYLVESMMGKQGTDFGGSWAAGVAAARADFAVWTARVQNYEANGWVNFNDVVVNCQPYIQANINTTTHDVFFFDNNSNPGACTSDDTITFSDNLTSIYQIKKICGNPLGNQSPLTPASYDVQLSASSSPGQGPPSPFVSPGSVITVTARLNNIGTSASQAGTLQIMDPGSQYAAQTPAPIQTVLSSGEPAGGYRANSTIPGAVGENWFWDVNSLVPGASSQGSVTFTVPANVPPGAFSVVIWYTPPTLNGAPVSTSLTFNVASARTPALSGRNGDVHAGDCGATPQTGNVTAASGSGSYGEYVVSGAGAVNNFSSNNGVSQLTLGSSGGYACLTRPDLLGVAKTARLAGGYITIPGSSFDVTNRQGVYFFDGPVLNISGTIGQPVGGNAPVPLTIVATNGSIRITNSIHANSANAYAPKDVPSLGLIAAGNVYINPAAVEVNAYIFSNGTIYTCDTPTVDQCQLNGTLVVNGFLMGKRIVFGRLGQFNAVSAPGFPTFGEVVTLTPQLYLNPPAFFSTADVPASRHPQGQGERAPRF
jgi:hypothetical protein